MTSRISTVTAEGMHNSGIDFFFRFLRSEHGIVPTLVTNKHVLQGTVSMQFTVFLAEVDEATQTINVSEAG